MEDTKEKGKITCNYCKKEIDDNVKFCPECGKQINSKNEEINNSSSSQSQTNYSTLSIIGFISSVCGIITCGVSSIAGLVISIIASNDGSKKGEKEPLATAGIIISVIILGLATIAIKNNINNNTNNSNNSKIESEPHYVKKIKVIDFSEMSKEDIKSWCDENSINCYITSDYSDIVEVNKFVSQSVEANDKVEENGRITIIYSLGIEPTISQKNAVRKAESYLRYSAFSREGLIEQLEYEKYSHDDAEYAVDHITVDWNEQAVKKAESYLKYSAFSRDGLIDQLLYEGFSYEQAVYGVEQNGL